MKSDVKFYPTKINKKDIQMCLALKEMYDADNEFSSPYADIINYSLLHGETKMILPQMDSIVDENWTKK